MVHRRQAFGDTVSKVAGNIQQRATPQRSGAFGRSTRASGDKSSFGLQRARNAAQGRALGGTRPSPRRSAASVTKSRAQLFTQRVGSLQNRTNAPRRRVPVSRNTPFARRR